MSFLFERNFDDELEKEGSHKPSTQQAASFSAAELEESHRQSHATGYQEGFEAGIAQGKQEAEAAARLQTDAILAESLQNLIPEINFLLQSLDNRLAARERDLVLLCQIIAKRLLPEIEQKFAQKRITAFARYVTNLTEGAEGIEIKVAPDVLKPVQNALCELPKHKRSGLIISSEPGLANSQASASWRNGGADIDGKALTKNLLTLIEQIAQSPDQEPKHHDQ